MLCFRAILFCTRSVSDGNSGLLRRMVPRARRYGPAGDQHGARLGSRKPGASHLGTRTGRRDRRTRDGSVFRPGYERSRTSCSRGCRTRGEHPLLGLADGSRARDTSDDLVARRCHACHIIWWPGASLKNRRVSLGSRRHGREALVFHPCRDRRRRAIHRPQASGWQGQFAPDCSDRDDHDDIVRNTDLGGVGRRAVGIAAVALQREDRFAYAVSGAASR